MPYDPNGAEDFRKALRDLDKLYGLTPTELGRRFQAALRAKGLLQELSLSRPSIERFVRGQELPEKFDELCFLYDMLAGDRRYRKHLPNLQYGNESADATLLPAALAGFFSSGKEATIGDIRASFAGEYLMVRRDFDRAAAPDGVRVSTVIVTGTENGVRFEERQDFQQSGDTPGYRQYDTGFLFPYADFIFFLTKETPPGTAVKLGVIEDALPNVGYRDDAGRPVPVGYFEGRVTVNSKRRRFPSARFACVRFHPSRQAAKSGIIPLESVPDPRAREFIRRDFRLPDGGSSNQ